MHLCTRVLTAASAATAIFWMGCSGGSSQQGGSTGGTDRMIQMGKYVSVAVTDSGGTRSLFDAATDGTVGRERCGCSTSAYSYAYSTSQSAYSGDILHASSQITVTGPSYSVGTVSSNGFRTSWCSVSAGYSGNQQTTPPVGLAVAFDENSAARDGMSPEDISQAEVAADRIASLATAQMDGSQRSRSSRVIGILPWEARWFATFADATDNTAHDVVPDRWDYFEAVVTVLANAGYHPVAQYAVLPRSYGTDFELPVSFHGVPMQKGVARDQPEAYRIEAAIVQKDGKCTYYVQHNEPNPEIFSYRWPFWDWGDYVWWWHSTH